MRHDFITMLALFILLWRHALGVNSSVCIEKNKYIYLGSVLKKKIVKWSDLKFFFREILRESRRD